MMRLPIDTEPMLRTAIETRMGEAPDFLGEITSEPSVKTFNDGQSKVALLKSGGSTTATMYIRSGPKLYKVNLQEVV